MGSPRKLVLKSGLSPGDIVMLTAAVRDIHRAAPGKFLTDVRTPCPGLWENNPFVTPIGDGAGEDVEEIDCKYPLIHSSNQGAYHFIHGYTQFLSRVLGLTVAPTEFRGDIHISDEEKGWFSQVREIVGADVPFWIVTAGGKRDFTIKWWEAKRYQEVVDHFGGKVLFVQVGAAEHHHPPLDGVIDLRGKTDLRQLVRLVYHSSGVLCPVTFLMHLAAAVPTRDGSLRPCVVVAGGREPPQWEAYPGHQFLHTVGSLSCCSKGGCWRSRTVPLGDGDEKDKSLCVDVVGGLPKCMDMITPAKVVDAIQVYLDGGVAKPLNDKEVKTTLPFLAGSKGTGRPAAAGSPKISGGTIIRVLGLRRSGTHAVQNWLAGLFDGPVCYLNDVSRKREVRPDHPSDCLPSIRRRPRARLDATKELLLYSYEDLQLEALALHPFPHPDPDVDPDSIFDVIMLRDPFNTIASRLKIKRDRPENRFATNMILGGDGGARAFPALWKSYALEFLGETCHLTNRRLPVNFNRWAADKGYRDGIAETLGGKPDDSTIGTVTRFGFGSSFEGMAFDGKAGQMDLANRWRFFEDDPEFLEMTGDPELRKLSERIFGTVCP